MRTKIFLIGILIFLSTILIWFFINNNQQKKDQPDQILISSKNEQTSTSTFTQNFMPNLNNIQNVEARKIIEKYYSQIKPIRDELQKNIPGGKIIYQEDSMNVTPEIEAKWNSISDETEATIKSLSLLNKVAESVLLQINVTNAKARIYINDALVFEIESLDSTNNEYQLRYKDDYAKYIKLGDEIFDNSFVLNEGQNSIRVAYSILDKSISTTPVAFTVSTPYHAPISTKDRLVMTEKPISVVNGTVEKTSGEISGTFILK